MGRHPAVFDWDRDKASSHDGKPNSGTIVVTQWKRCHENDETASVRRVRCRVVNEARLKQVVAYRDRASSHDAEAMAVTSACVYC